EKEIRAARCFFPFEPISSCCPRENTSTRASVKNLIRQLSKENYSVYNNLGAAMRFDPDRVTLWPRPINRVQMRERYLQVTAWHRNNLQTKNNREIAVKGKEDIQPQET
ncbi:MAG TPA: hypothetical protein VFF80_00325, partial [Bacillota bacterium]|nr:hypothetical protein [Bacillota bacterium]